MITINNTIAYIHHIEAPIEIPNALPHIPR